MLRMWSISPFGVTWRIYEHKAIIGLEETPIVCLVWERKLRRGIKICQLQIIYLMFWNAPLALLNLYIALRGWYLRLNDFIIALLQFSFKITMEFRIKRQREEDEESEFTMVIDGNPEGDSTVHSIDDRSNMPIMNP